jgi:hypothetical protein
MKSIKKGLSIILVLITPVVSFLSFDLVGFKNIYYKFNSSYFGDYYRRVMIGSSIYLPNPPNFIATDNDVGYIHYIDNWFLDKDFTTPVEIVSMPKHNLEVSARWFLEAWEGNSIENYIYNMFPGQKYTIDVTSTGGQYFFLKFTPTITRQYIFSSVSSLGTDDYQDTKAYLYSESIENPIAFNDDYYSNLHFRITRELISNRTYYLKVQYSSISQIGSFDVGINL